MNDSAYSLGSLIREDFESHGRDVTRPGFQALLIYRLGVARMSIDSGLLRKPCSAVYRLAFTYARNVLGIELPYTAKIGRRVVLEHQHGIVVHGQAVIGDDCVLRHGVTLGNRHRKSPQDAPVLERGVNVGAGAKILGKIRVGAGAAIGANAVVLADVPAGTVASGIPARVRLGARDGEHRPAARPNGRVGNGHGGNGRATRESPRPEGE